MDGKYITLLLSFILLLAGCTHKYAKPYSAEKTIQILSEQYGVEIELVNKKVLKSPPYASTQYTLQDKKNGFSFTAIVSVEMDRHIPIIQHCINDNHRRATMLHRRIEALHIAAGYGLWLVPIDSLEQLPQDEVYISNVEQIADAANLYFDLKHCYDFHLKENPVIDSITPGLLFKENPRSDYITPEFRVYQLFNNNEDGKLKARFLCDFDYEEYSTDPIKESEWLKNPAAIESSLKLYWNDKSRGVFDVPERKDKQNVIN